MSARVNIWAWLIVPVTPTHVARRSRRKDGYRKCKVYLVLSLSSNKTTSSHTNTAIVDSRVLQKFLRIPCLSSKTSGAGVASSVESPSSSAQSFASVYVTPTVLPELPAASQPRPASPFHDSERTSAPRLAGEWRSNVAYISPDAISFLAFRMWSCTAAYDENWSGHRTADNWRKALLESYYKGIGNTYYTRIPRPMRAYKKTRNIYFGGTRSVGIR